MRSAGFVDEGIGVDDDERLSPILKELTTAKAEHVCAQLGEQAGVDDADWDFCKNLAEACF